MSYDVTDGRYDRPGDRPAVPVRRSLLLCSVPRSGSSLLADALHGTGRLSSPTEYFDPTVGYLKCSARWRTTDMIEYVAALHRHRVDDNGLFSAKMHWYQLQWLCEQLCPHLGLAPRRGRGTYPVERAVVRYVFPGCGFVRVRRRDRDRQAVSWAIADQIDRWAYDDPRSTKTSADYVYDFHAVDRFRRLLDEHEAHWDAFLAGLGAPAYTVVYEDLVEHYVDTVTAVAAHAGVELSAADVPAPRLQRQADERSEEVLARYQADRVARGTRGARAARIDGAARVDGAARIDGTEFVEGAERIERVDGAPGPAVEVRSPSSRESAS